MDFTVRQMDFEGAKRLYPQHGLNGIGVHTPSVSELTVNDKRELLNCRGWRPLPKTFVLTEKPPLTIAVNGGLLVERKGVEPSTFALRTRRPTDASEAGKELTATPSPACTAACTRNPENSHETTGEGDVNQAANDAEAAADQGADSLAALAAVLLDLPAADRAKLAAMLLQGGDQAGDKAKGKTTRKSKGQRKAKG